MQKNIKRHVFVLVTLLISFGCSLLPPTELVNVDNTPIASKTNNYTSTSVGPYILPTETPTNAKQTLTPMMVSITSSPTNTVIPINTAIEEYCANLIDVNKAGGLIAFTKEDTGGNLNIYTISPDGSELQLLIGSDLMDSQPEWSPDGSKLAYIAESHDDLISRMVVVDQSGNHLADTPDLINALGAITWAPDGENIAFRGRKYGIEKDEIYVFNISTNEIVDFHDGFPDIFSADPTSWAPDSSFLLFYGAYTVRLTAFKMFRIDISEKLISAYELDAPIETRPLMQPDGNLILYIAHYPGDVPQAYLMNVDGSERHKISEHESGVKWAGWSPNGKWINYGSNDGADETVFIVNVDGVIQREFISEPGFDEYSSNNRYIAKVTHQDGQYNLYTLDLCGDMSMKLLVEDVYLSPITWSIVTND